MANDFAHGPFTLFLPTNKAFASLTPDDKLRLKDQCFLKKQLKHHLVKGIDRADTLKDGYTMTNLANSKLTISQLGDVSILLILLIGLSCRMPITNYRIYSAF